MAIQCPCGSRCKGIDTSGKIPSVELAYQSKTFPPQFEKYESSFQKIARIALEVAGYNYLVYECPRCRCEILFGQYDAPAHVELFWPNQKLARFYERNRCTSEVTDTQYTSVPAPKKIEILLDHEMVGISCRKCGSTKDAIEAFKWKCTS